MSDPHHHITILSRLPDPCIDRSKEHELTARLAIALGPSSSAAKAATTWPTSATPARTGCKPPNGIPSHDTFNRLFQALAPAALAGACAQWIQSLRLRLDRELVGLDGKAARRATAAGQSPHHLVSAWPRRTASP